ncbi:unnamed protein product [Malus baccata var. baccata]
MTEELRALEENHTWSLVQLPPGKRVVGSRWIYKTKFKVDGFIERHKARLVARGFTQNFGVYYKEPFAPEKAGFVRSNADSSLFMRTGTSGKLVVLIYVDDLIITRDSTMEIEALKLLLHQTFAIKDRVDLEKKDGAEVDSAMEMDVGSIGQGITMHNNQSTVISGYTDADWVGNAIDKKSTIGYCTFVGGNLVIWKSKKQQVIARSSAEAEYRAMAATACEL